MHFGYYGDGLEVICAGRRAMHFAKTDVTRYLSEKRARKADRRIHKQHIAETKMQAKRKAMSSHFGRRSKILEMMAKGMSGGNVIYKNRVARFVIPASFSIIDSPDRTLAALGNLAREMHTRQISSVFLDFKKLTEYDLGANGLLDVLVDELSTQARQTRHRIRWHGTYPADPAHRRYLQAMGVIKRLKIAHEYPTKDEEGKLALFDTRCKHYVRALNPRGADKKARVTQRFADHINRCLASVKRELTPEARSRLCQYIGEIIDNAEEHAGLLDWAIQGYLDAHLSNPVCEIVIFNFGRTIAHSFEELPAPSYTRHQIQQYIELHKKNRFFQSGWRKEDLYTLIALQGNVSSKNLSATDTRGNGTVDLIDLFQRVHTECMKGQNNLAASMVIVSGSTYILFDGKYQMSPNSIGNKIIAFNDANDLHQKPDSKYVRQLDGITFPGTLISLKFPLSNDATIGTGEVS